MLRGLMVSLLHDRLLPSLVKSPAGICYFCYCMTFLLNAGA